MQKILDKRFTVKHFHTRIIEFDREKCVAMAFAPQKPNVNAQKHSLFIAHINCFEQLKTERQTTHTQLFHIDHIIFFSHLIKNEFK